jgi:hypothetical protein
MENIRHIMNSNDLAPETARCFSSFAYTAANLAEQISGYIENYYENIIKYLHIAMAPCIAYLRWPPTTKEFTVQRVSVLELSKQNETYI